MAQQDGVRMGVHDPAEALKLAEVKAPSAQVSGGQACPRSVFNHKATSAVSFKSPHLLPNTLAALPVDLPQHATHVPQGRGQRGAEGATLSARGRGNKEQKAAGSALMLIQPHAELRF